jgi:hypothetical protein
MAKSRSRLHTFACDKHRTRRTAGGKILAGNAKKNAATRTKQGKAGTPISMAECAAELWHYGQGQSGVTLEIGSGTWPVSAGARTGVETTAERGRGRNGEVDGEGGGVKGDGCISNVRAVEAKKQRQITVEKGSGI